MTRPAMDFDAVVGIATVDQETEQKAIPVVCPAKHRQPLLVICLTC